MIFICVFKVFFAVLSLLTAREFHSFHRSPPIPLLEYVPEVEVNVEPSNNADLPLSPDQLLDMNQTIVEDLPLSDGHILDADWVDTIIGAPLANVYDHCLDDYTENLPLSLDQLLDMNQTNVEDLPLSDGHILDTDWVDTIMGEPLANVYDHCLDDYTGHYAFPVFSITFLAGVLLLFGALFYKQANTFWRQKSAMVAELQELRNKTKKHEEMITEHSLLQDEVVNLKMEIASSRQNAVYLHEKMEQERTIAQEEKRCHEIQLLEKEKELTEIKSKLQETQRLLDTKIQESETKVEQIENEEGLVTRQQTELEEEDKPRKAISLMEWLHNTDQDNYVTFKGEEIYCEPTGPTTMLTAKVEVDKALHPLIVGKSGLVVSNIEYFSRTKIHMPAQYIRSSMVSVTGDKENIQCALDMIEAILINNNEYESDKRNPDDSISFKGNVLYGHPTGQPEFLKVSIALPNEQRRAVVGYKGRNVACVEKVSKVEILLPRFHENSNVVSVTGRKSNIQLALRMMEYLLRNFGY